MSLICRVYSQKKIPKLSPGFSLLELILAIGLGGMIVFAAMTLVLNFANTYLAIQQSGRQDWEQVCYEKFMKLSLKDFYASCVCTSNVFDREIDAHLINSGIFWETTDLHAFEEIYRPFVVGLIWRGESLYFIWTDSENTALTDADFEEFELFRDVRTICLMVYDMYDDTWSEKPFDDKTAREILSERSICYLRVNRDADTKFFPLFGY